MFINSGASTVQLTPNIRLRYADLKLLSTENQETSGYLVFQAKSLLTNEIHHIRVLNLNSIFAKTNINLTTTLFLQETFRLCSLHAGSIILDTLEFFQGVICYAMKPNASLLPESPTLNISKLLKNLLTDIGYIVGKGTGELCLSKSRMYQIQSNNDKTSFPEKETGNSDATPVYFLQDWNQVVWMPMLAEEAQNKNMNRVLLENTTEFIETIAERACVYDLALGLLELYGIKKQEIENYLINFPNFYDGFLRNALLQSPELDEKIFTRYIKSILAMMLDKNTMERPRIQEIIKFLELKDQDEHELRNLLTAEVSKRAKRKDSNDIKNCAILKAEDDMLSIDQLHPQMKELLSKKDVLNVKEINFEIEPLSDIKHPIGRQGAVLLSQNKTWTNLTKLYLGNNFICAEGAKALSSNTIWTSLKILGLEANSLGDGGVAALSNNSTWVHLTTLFLSSNSIGDQGASVLGTNKAWTNLMTLDLADNKIGDSGAVALSYNGSWKNLTEIVLTCNEVDSQGEKALKKRWPNILLHLKVGQV